MSAHRDPAAQHQRPARFDRGDGHGHLGSEPDLGADHDVLPLGHDPVGAVDVATDQVLQRVVAVEAAAPLPELRDGYFALPQSGVSSALAEEAIGAALRVPMEVLIACQRAGTATDVSADLAAIDIPTLIIHGDADESAPLPVTGKPSAELVAGAEQVVYPGGPHGLYVSHRERFTEDLLRFIAA